MTRYPSESSPAPSPARETPPTTPNAPAPLPARETPPTTSAGMGRAATPTATFMSTMETLEEGDEIQSAAPTQIGALEIEHAAPVLLAQDISWVWFVLVRFFFAIVALGLEAYVLCTANEQRYQTKMASLFCSVIILLLSCGDLYVQCIQKQALAHREALFPCCPFIVCLYDEHNRNIFDEFKLFTVLCGIVSIFLSGGELLAYMNPHIPIVKQNIFPITLAFFIVLSLLISAIRKAYYHYHTNTTTGTLEGQGQGQGEEQGQGQGES